MDGAQRLAAGSAEMAAVLAVALFATSVERALAPLAGLRVGGTMGTMRMVAAVLLCLATCLSPREAAAVPAGRRTRHHQP